MKTTAYRRRRKAQNRTIRMTLKKRKRRMGRNEIDHIRTNRTHTPRTAQSADQKDVGESEEEQEEESGNPETENGPGESEEEEPQKKKKSRSEYTPSRRSSHEPIKKPATPERPGKRKKPRKHANQLRPRIEHIDIAIREICRPNNRSTDRHSADESKHTV